MTVAQVKIGDQVLYNGMPAIVEEVSVRKITLKFIEPYDGHTYLVLGATWPQIITIESAPEYEAPIPSSPPDYVEQAPRRGRPRILTEGQELEIARLYAMNGTNGWHITRRELAERYGVTRSTIDGLIKKVNPPESLDSATSVQLKGVEVHAQDIELVPTIAALRVSFERIEDDIKNLVLLAEGFKNVIRYYEELGKANHAS